MGRERAGGRYGRVARACATVAALAAFARAASADYEMAFERRAMEEDAATVRDDALVEEASRVDDGANGRMRDEAGWRREVDEGTMTDGTTSRARDARAREEAYDAARERDGHETSVGSIEGTYDAHDGMGREPEREPEPEQELDPEPERKPEPEEEPEAAPQLRPKVAQKVSIPPDSDAETALLYLREWLSVNRVPVKHDATAVETVAAVSDSLLKTSKAMRSMKKTVKETEDKVIGLESELQSEIEIQRKAFAERDELLRRLSELEDAASEESKASEDFRAHIADLETQLTEAHRSSASAENLQEQLKEKASALAALEENMKVLETQLDKARQSANEKNLELERKVHSLEDKISIDAEDDVDEKERLRTQIAELEGQLAEQGESNTDSLSGDSEKRIRQLTAELEELRASGETCSPGNVESQTHAPGGDMKALQEDYDLLREEYDKLVLSAVSKKDFDEVNSQVILLTSEIDDTRLELERAKSEALTLHESLNKVQNSDEALKKCEAAKSACSNTLAAQNDAVQKLKKALQECSEREPEPTIATDCHCEDECSAQLNKLRNNLQKQADSLRRRTFEAEVKFEDQKERCDEIEREHNVTKSDLREQTELVESTKKTLEEERDMKESGCPPCAQQSQSDENIEEVSKSAEVIESNVTASTIDDRRVDEAEIVEPREKGQVDEAEIMEPREKSQVDESGMNSEVEVRADEVAPYDLSVPPDHPVETPEKAVVEETTEVPTGIEENQTETIVAEQHVHDEGPVGAHEVPTALENDIAEGDGDLDTVAKAELAELNWNDGDDEVNKERESSEVGSARAVIDKVANVITTILSSMFSILSRVMELILKQMWKTKHGNKLLSFMEQCDNMFTSVASKVDSMVGTEIASNKDLIKFSVHATIFGPPIILTFILMRVVSVLLGGGSSKASQAQGKWKGPPSRAPGMPQQPEAPRRNDVPPFQYGDQATRVNPSSSAGPAPPPMMMAPPVGPMAHGIPSPATSPRGGSPHYPTPTPFGNSYTPMSNPPPHIREAPPSQTVNQPSQPPGPGATPVMQRTPSLTGPNGQPMDEMTGDGGIDSESGAQSAPFVMMGNPAMTPQWQSAQQLPGARTGPMPSASLAARAPQASAPPFIDSAGGRGPPPPGRGAPHGGRGRGPPPGRGYPGRGPPPPGRGYPGRGPPPPFAPTKRD